MSDILATPVDELEVSVKASAFLSELGVATLGELLALPRIEAPRLVAAELSMLFDELEVEFAGEIVAAAAVPTLKAEGTLEQRWATIRAWLEDNHPHALHRWNEPAKPSAVAAAENAVGHELPADYKRFLAMHDGQKDLASMVEGCTLLPAAKVAARYGALAKLYKDVVVPEDADVEDGVKQVEHDRAWIPIGVSARGRDLLCLDMDPGEGGVPGQVILLVIDDDARPLVARSFTDLLSRYFDEIQTGDLDLDEDDLDDEEDAGG